MNQSSSAPALVLVGPTAVGKGTVVERLRSLYPNLRLSVSATTRPPRPGEMHGEHYFFVSEDEFDEMVQNDEMLEWAVVHGRDKYGTPREAVEECLAANVPIILELDLEGARQVRQTMPEAVFVFLEPPSWEEMKQRLEQRGTEDAETRARRLETAKVELAAADEFDFRVTNDNLDDAVRELAGILGLG